MKKLKKFAALLLVGVMALALLTACGGGGGPTEEQKVLAQISREKGVQVTNDAELRAIAEGHLNMDREELDGSVKQDGDWSNIGVVVKRNNEQSYIGISIRIKNYYKK